MMKKKRFITSVTGRTDTAATSAFKIKCNLCSFATADGRAMESHLGWDGHFKLGQVSIF